MKDFSFVTHSHPAYIETLYQDFRNDPASVDPEWAKFFEGVDFALSSQNGKAAAPGAAMDEAQLMKEFSVYRLIQAYRKKGHLEAKTNPIRERKNRNSNLDLAYSGLGEADLSSEFYAGVFAGLGKASLQDILAFLNKCYSS